MNTGSSFAKSPRRDTKKSKKCKAFKDISKYFSKKEWTKLGYTEKITYVYMKRNYDTMTNLGLRPTLPVFVCSDKQATESQGNNSDEDLNHENQVFSITGCKKRGRNVWTNRLRKRKNLAAYEEISEPEEHDSLCK
ncbi:protein SSXA1-like [Cynocephalus volans]|uniref:protein SSXA1-like n=1 Tax=Cynocephalus volans TaxID=110931 RepID=UPI002FCA5B46